MKFHSRISQGFSLVEVALVLGIASFVLIALVGLTGTAINANKESQKSLEAASVASQLATRWMGMVEWNSDPNTMVTPATLPTGFPIPITIPNAGGSASSNTQGILINEGGAVTSDSMEQAFRLTYKLTRSSAQPKLLQLHIRLSWPARANPAAGGVDPRSHYEIVTAALLGAGAQ